MKKLILLLSLIFLIAGLQAAERFPDGSIIPDWFKTSTPIDISQFGQSYLVTDFGVANDSNIIQTKNIQKVIDEAWMNGGGVIVIPKGTYLSGSLFFREKTHLHLQEGAVLKGSDDISDFELLPTRIEGQSIKYFAALINADNVDGFTISGKGTLNGNGLRYWKSFWLRRAYNPQCTNLEEMRPRLLYVSNSKDVQISGIRMINSPFWTSHFYRCENLKLLELYIYAPKYPVRAPSSDAIDLDVCTNVLIKNCYMSVNDDAVALKGGKGPFADKSIDNGGNYNIIIEDCVYGFCHSALTCGSESVHNRNIIFRRCKVNEAQRLLHLKMRPDTPQRYEHILIEDIEGDGILFMDIRPWTQFFDLQGETEIKVSYADNITFRNITFKCDIFLNIRESDEYTLSNFRFDNVQVVATDESVMVAKNIKGFEFKNTYVNGLKVNEK